MNRISLQQAQTAIHAALAKGRELQLKPLCVAVLDAGGHLIALGREDGASNLRPQIAIAKASGALGLGVSSRRIGEMAAERPTFIATVAGLNPDGLLPAAGGVIVVGNEGHAIGAIGITGDTSDNDETCALAGLAAAGLRAQS
jgi:uncharacterized protein GlcG (DUF336 family)